MQKRKEREKRAKILLKKIIIIRAENVPNLGKEIDTQAQEAQRAPNKMNARKFMPEHIVIKILKIKDKKRILKETREMQLVTYNGNPMRLSADFPAKRKEGRRKRHDIFKSVERGKNIQERILCLV